MYKLLQFTPGFGLPNASPFCMKLEGYLRAVGAQFEVEYSNAPNKMPKGKMPCLLIGGKLLADSSCIIDNLESTFKLDAHLSQVERSTLLAYQRLVEEHLYWCLVYCRWQDDRYWPFLKSEFFSVIPAIIRGPISSIIRKGVFKNLKGAGMNRHSLEEVYAFADQDLEALSVFLGEKRYFMGDKITTLDLSALGLLANIHFPNMDTPLKTSFNKFSNLKHYTERLMKEVFEQGQ